MKKVIFWTVVVMAMGFLSAPYFKQKEIPLPNENAGKKMAISNSVYLKRMFSVPIGVEPRGLVFFDGYFWTLTRDNKGKPNLCRVDSKTGEIEFVKTVKTHQLWWGGLTATNDSILHVRGGDGGIDWFYGEGFAGNFSVNSRGKAYTFSDAAVQSTEEEDYLWTVGSFPGSGPGENAETYRLYKLSLRTGETTSVAPFNMDDDLNQNFGLAFDGTWLWAAMKENLYKVDPATGEVVKKVSLSCSDSISNLAWDGHNLWGASFSSGTFYRIIIPAPRKPSAEMPKRVAKKGK